MPLLEIVSGPDMRSGQEAAAYGEELRRVVTFLGVSNANMQVAVLSTVTGEEMTACPVTIWVQALASDGLHCLGVVSNKWTLSCGLADLAELLGV